MRIITTGGTIDKLPNWTELHDRDQDMFPERSYVPKIVVEARPATTFFMDELMRVDSLDMTDEQIEAVANQVVGSNDSQLIVTHGTDKMLETAQAIDHMSRRRAAAGKVIILTGAMIPYSQGQCSDAVDNMSMALAAINHLDSGVYVAMSGIMAPHWLVEKNMTTDRFQINSNAAVI